MNPAVDAKKGQVTGLLTDVFRLMEYPAKFELKDMPDGGIGVAVHFDGELPGITPGKRSYLVDCLQFIVNKALNRPNQEKRWVSLGVGTFPEPRPPKPETPVPAAPKTGEKPVAKVTAPPPPPPKPKSDEATAKVTPDAAVTGWAAALAQKATTHRRLYAVLSLSADDRARLVQSTPKAAGLSVRCEGEGHWRRVRFEPANVAPLAKKQVMPDYDDDEEE
jgi:predicted RNA-binding protein Jag